MTDNNFLALRANLALNSPFASGRKVSGYWEYLTKRRCLSHYFQMCMYMRRNYTSLSVESLCKIMSLPKRKIYEVSFSRGFNPQDDDHIFDLAMMLQRYEARVQDEDMMELIEIRGHWDYFTRVLSCL